MSRAATIDARDLKLELLDPNAIRLVRLFRHPGGHWDPPDAKYRTLRVDPPDAHKPDFAVLYTASTLSAVAMECRILRADHLDRHTWDQDLAAQYRVARYTYLAPALFIPIDGENRRHLDLSGEQRKFAGYAPYQKAAWALFERFGQLAHGLSWESFHRNQPGRVYAIWHHRKAAMALAVDAGPYHPLAGDAEWLRFLASNPDIESTASP
ncbi:MAG: RES domain-containing protein [Rhodocyclaceae bacterium]|nr:RES domain-containing protein [Rhodocyclaceae bacterium]MBX3666816.1 RES domain-containing protein [Rhodocyclaceae bacterium]